MTFNLVTAKPVTGNAAGVYFVKNAETPSDNGIYVINVTGQAPIPMANPININDYLKVATALLTYLKIEDAENTYAPLNSPNFTGNPKSPTPNGENEEEIVNVEFINNLVIDYLKLSFLEKSTNLFNKSTVTEGSYIIGLAETIDEDFWVSDFIPVLPNTQYTRSFKADKFYNWYNSNKTYISSAKENSTITSPINAAYIRINCRYQEFTPETFMFVQGSTLPEFKNYYEAIDNLLNIENISNKLNNRFYGKKLAILGDSITAGFVPRNNQLSFGKISTNGINVTGFGTHFISDMVDSNIICNGETATISEVLDEEHLVLYDPFITYETVETDYTIQYNNYPGTLYSYAVHLAKKLNMTLYNYGVSGSLLGKVNSGTSGTFEERYSTMVDDASLIIVMGGTNDIRTNLPIGVMSDRNQYTWYGALHRLCQGLIKKYHRNTESDLGYTKQIVFLTMLPNWSDINGGATGDTYVGGTFKDFANAEKEVCAYYGIPVYDLMSESGLCPKEFRTIQGWQDGYEGMYNVEMPDGTHPNELAHKKIADKVFNYIKTL